MCVKVIFGSCLSSQGQEGPELSVSPAYICMQTLLYCKEINKQIKIATLF